MIIRTVYFTVRGEKSAARVFDGWDAYIPQYREGDLSAWVEDSFKKHLPILFIGACGIAVRHIAPFVSDKMTDSPVLVMDEGGSYVIPILSGHLGGANALAQSIADRIGAQAVITTATDVNGLFAVDVFASENHLAVRNREGIRAVSSKLLAGEKISICIDTDAIVLNSAIPEEFKIVPYPPKEQVDILIMDPSASDQSDVPADAETKVCAALQYHLLLTPKKLVVGMGCRRGKSFEELKNFLLRTCAQMGIPEESLYRQLYAITSIDVKKDEIGLMMLAQYFHVPFITYTAQELEKAEGDFSVSSFVAGKVGVSNVCERSAVCAAGENRSLILQKKAENGMTIAAALKKGCIQTWRMKE